jgi:hypothetical protein
LYLQLSSGRSLTNHSLQGARRNISTLVLTFWNSVGFFFSFVLIEISVREPVCDGAAYSGPFRKHHLNRSEDLWRQHCSAETCSMTFCSSIVEVFNSSTWASSGFYS